MAAKTEEDGRGDDAMDGIETGASPQLNGASVDKERPSTSPSRTGSDDAKSPATTISPDEVKPDAGTVSPPDQAAAPKPTRKASQKVPRAPPMLFDHLPD